ncbi:hypothetical protein J6590_091940 [Homalodisca vitripennis]|nr:hypothetical protein J6590_091940 [Homalodisca vitripennis]
MALKVDFLSKDELIYELWFRISARPLQEVYMDVFGPLPRSSRRDEFILIMVDDFTRCNWVVPLRKVNSGNEAEVRQTKCCVTGLAEVSCGSLLLIHFILEMVFGETDVQPEHLIQPPEG